MKVLVRALVVAGLMGSAAGAASAQADGMDPATMTCADFTAMSQEDQTAALDAMAAAGDMATGEAATDDMAADQMADDMAADDMAADGAATDEMASDDMAAEDGMMSERMTAMTAACEGAPDMMATDAMTSAMDN